MHPHLGYLITDGTRSFDIFVEVLHILTKVLVLGVVRINSASATECQVEEHSRSMITNRARGPGAMLPTRCPLLE